VKRLLDVCGAAVGLFLLSPVLAVIAIAVKHGSPGPVLFRQTRVGRDGRPFSILKFRTMRVESAGREITVGADPRITPVGALLRAHKLDELPQLVNVLRGDMSLVGPRPEVPRYVALYPPEIKAIVLSVRPGITDPTSLTYRDESTLLGEAADPEQYYREILLPEKLRSYVDYVRNRSFGHDVRIIFTTIGSMFHVGRGG